MKRPGSVTTVAWIWIITGFVLALSSVIGLLSLQAMGTMGFEEIISQLPADMAPEFQVILGLINYILLLTILQGLFGIAALIGGIYFLQLRNWARMILEILTWLGLIGNVGFGVLWWFLWSRISSVSNELFSFQDYATAGQVVGIVVMAIVTIPLVKMIIFLRGKTVRNAILEAGFENSAAGPTSA